MARVLWRDAQGKEGTVVLSRQEVRIGRATDCEIRTDDTMVSRHHARIYRAGNAYIIEDMGSANGMYFEERQIQRHSLVHGDAVRCGSLWIRFVNPATDPLANVADRGVHGTMVLPQAPMNAFPGGVAAAIAPQRPTDPQMAQSATMPPPRPSSAPVTDPFTSSQLVPAMAGSEVVAGTSELEREARALRRRVEQLQAELKLVRSGQMGPEKASSIETLESDVAALQDERAELVEQLATLQRKLEINSRDRKLQEAEQVVHAAARVSTRLHDTLSSLRIELIAATDEFEQFAGDLPRPSFELIRQALRDAGGYVDTSRELMRELAEIVGRDEP